MTAWVKTTPVDSAVNVPTKKPVICQSLVSIWIYGITTPKGLQEEAIFPQVFHGNSTYARPFFDVVKRKASNISVGKNTNMEHTEDILDEELPTPYLWCLLQV